MNCELCGKAEATVHITQIFGDQFARIDLCEVCAKKRGVNDPTGMSRLVTLIEEVKKRKSEGGE